MSNLKQYLPNIYDAILEVEALISSENQLFDNLGMELTSSRNNQYASIAEVGGIAEYERMLKIVPNPNAESLEFRRERVVNRLSTLPPFSLKFLKLRLDEIIGVGKYTISIDYLNYTLYVESSAENQSWFHEILVTITKLKPANIVFINKPLLHDSTKLSESINLSQGTFNYKLGTAWILGLKPFKTFDDMGVIKMASTHSIKPGLLNNIASFTSTDISKIRINGTTIISEFLSKTVANNLVIVEYEILASTGITEVTEIELLDASDMVLTSSLVYIPVLESIIMKHNILIEEGA